ncbi:MAG: hypothetical protein HY314_12130 [Acidobacteria bacterium]|nr:hypothetical protein [Acidobacteriota bacterium]
MKRILTLMTLALLLATAWGIRLVQPISAQPLQQEQQEQQQQQPQQQGPPWSYDEAQAFNTAIAETDLAKKTQSLEQFLTKYPESALTPVVRRILVFLYLQNQNLQKAFDTAEVYFNARHEKYAEAFKTIWGADLGKAGAMLPTEPTQDFQLLYTLVDAANRAVKGNNHTFDDLALKYSERMLAMLSSGGVPPTMPSSAWKSNENVIVGMLHQTIGLVKLNRKEYDQASAALKKAGELNPSDPVTFYLQGEALRTSKYAELRTAVEQTRQKYNELTEQLKGVEEQVNQINTELEKLSKLPETAKNKARIEELTQQGKNLNDQGKQISDQLQPLSDQIDKQVAETDQVVDDMIRAYGKTVALTDNNASLKQLNQAARQYLESYYKYRHQGSLDGLQELIARLKTERP